MENLVRAAYRSEFCNAKGDLTARKIDLEEFRKSLEKQHPEHVEEIKDAVQR
jgi:hypothetical protein